MNPLKLLTLALLLLGCAAPPVQDPTPAERHVVVVSIDGLRPDFYLDAKWKAPNLQRLAKEGAHAKGIEGVFPSVTYPSHTTILTGVYPAKHGVISNTKWTDAGPSTDWYWDTAAIKTPTLWSIAREAKRSTAIVYWPVSVGADVDWVIPEKWADKGKSLELLEKLSTKGLLDDIRKSGVKLVEDDFGEDKTRVDRALSQSAAYLIRERKPALLFLHILNVDHEQHSHGRDHEKVHEAVEEVDRLVGDLQKAVKDAGIEPTTTIVITGDHGFRDIATDVAPNVLFGEAGLLPKDGAWQAIAHASGAQAAIHVKGGSDVEKKVMECLEKIKDDVTIVTRDELTKLGGDPGAFCVVVGKPGVTVSGRKGGGVNNKAGLKGNHGQLPTDPQLYTGLILHGRGVKGGASIEKGRLVDVGPTIAKLLDLSMKDVDGRALDDLLGK